MNSIKIILNNYPIFSMIISILLFLGLNQLGTLIFRNKSIHNIVSEISSIEYQKIIIAGNFIVSIVLVPFLLVLNSYILFALVIILGGTIGFLYNFLITDIGHLEKKHHVFAGIVIPLVAVLNLGVVVYATNRFISQLEVANQHNPWVVSVVFAAAVILPAIIDKLRR